MPCTRTSSWSTGAPTAMAGGRCKHAPSARQTHCGHWAAIRAGPVAGGAQLSVLVLGAAGPGEDCRVLTHALKGAAQPGVHLRGQQGRTKKGSSRSRRRAGQHWSRWSACDTGPRRWGSSQMWAAGLRRHAHSSAAGSAPRTVMWRPAVRRQLSRMRPTASCGGTRHVCSFPSCIGRPTAELLTWPWEAVSLQQSPGSPASGLTPDFWYSAVVSRETRFLSSPYCALMASIVGFRFCTASADSTCAHAGLWLAHRQPRQPRCRRHAAQADEGVGAPAAW